MQTTDRSLNFAHMLGEKKSLSQHEARALLNFLISDACDLSEKMKLLTLLTVKGETAEEIAGMASALREHMVPLALPGIEDAVDTCGTGGSGLARFNVSTLSAFLLAAAGVPVVKHGNKAASGRCGSFDVLETLGVNIMLGPEQLQKCFEKFKLAFVFAPLFHPAMKTMKEARTALGFRTVFNFLGPLVNPARTKRHVLGISDKKYLLRMAEVLQMLGTTHSLLVHGEDNLDEITLSGPTDIIELQGNTSRQYTIRPADLGLAQVQKFEDIGGKDAPHNAELFLALLEGKDTGSRRDFLLANAGAGFLVADRVKSLKEGVELARKTLESGAPHELFLAYRAFTKTL